MLERKKLTAELLRVSAAKAEMDFLIEEKLQEINRLKDAMAKQEAAEVSLKERIKNLGA